MKKRIRKRSGTHKSEFRKLVSSGSIIASIVIILVGLGFLYYFMIYGSVTECGDFACYQEYLMSCKKSFLVIEDDNYVYRYEILSKNGNSYCNVDVRLMRVKDGGDDAESLEGLNMICKVNKFEDIRPEKDMLACSGRLREELQEIIIDRLHNQILNNLGQIKAELG